ncbi:MAG: RNA 2',3'-cyclic phosphodiesterase [Planctomycetaceae bacterium]|nr:RNA 2',3'-cyclic phosphodiesterase [Planctomycetaceae bacterium]
MGRLRTFIAVAVSQDVRDRAEILLNRLSRSEINASWTKPENMHVTLKFLGDIDETLIPDLCRHVATTAESHAPFQLTFTAAGAFPSIDRPRAVWMGPGEGADEITKLQADLEENLLDLRIPRERRRFKPHLTLGRIREGGPRAEELTTILHKNAEFDGKSCKVEQVLTLASYLEKSGPTYLVLARAPLTGPLRSRLEINPASGLE